ncbi:MAG: hypothetical protein ONB31_02910 [candidate division KSB1 bacterium]|nr:hypothetical protein [candidate division KSB1 bacterium]
MPFDEKLLMNKLNQMKLVYEQAIREGKYTSLIRSKSLINLLHEFVIEELKKRVEASWIVTDKKVYGFPKTKQQDIMVHPPQNGNNVSVGPVMAVNVRSQLSSIDKNYDTLFERIFAEALNLHNRFPYMVLGYLYLLPKIGYDSKAADQREVEFSEKYNLEKYILSFSAIANRTGPTDVPWKYERVCLLIVDFESSPLKVIDDMSIFLKEALVDEKFAN